MSKTGHQLRASFFVALFLAIASIAVAQQPSVSAKVEVRILELDVVVTDRNGAPVHGLTAADFELYEDDRLQPVTNFSVRTVTLAAGEATVSQAEASATDAIWREAHERAVRERKPLVVFFRPKRCAKCDIFERDVVQHPAIARRMSQVVFAVAPKSSGAKSSVWTEDGAAVTVFDDAGTLRAKWGGTPEATQFGAILDAAIASAGHFRRAAAMTASHGPYAGASEAAVGLLNLGRPKEARALLDEAIAKGNAEERQIAEVSRAVLDARDGKEDAARAALSAIASAPASRVAAGEAWLALGTILESDGSPGDAARAFRTAAERGEPGSPTVALATVRAAELEAARTNVIRLVPPESQIVSGRQTIRTIVASPAVARVVFNLDGKDAASVTAPPFSAKLDFPRIPEARTVRVTALDSAGAEIGRDEAIVNGTGEVFWVRLVEPAAGTATGGVKTSLSLRMPSGRSVKEVALSWNDVTLATLTSAPWTTEITIPREVGILRAAATLDDGRTAEDALLLNATGYAERADVMLVELPLTVTPQTAITPSQVVVREGKKQRAVESVAGGADVPLTVGIVIDCSSSMYKRMADVQEAAMRFVDAVLAQGDRAFLISFNSTAQLVTPPTSDRQLVKRSILRLQPNGSTALHDAMMLGLMQFEGVKGRRALVVFSDGQDMTSRYRTTDVEELSRRANVPIHVLTPALAAAQTTPQYRNQNDARAHLDDTPMYRRPPSSTPLVVVAKNSGGRLYEVPELDRLARAFDEIANALRAQTLVTIRTDPVRKDNEWREIQVELAMRGAELRAPAGYYTPR